MWRNKEENRRRFYDELRKWQRSAAAQEAPRYIVNDSAGWRQVAFIENRRVWSLVSETSYSIQGGKFPAKILRFGIQPEAQYFLTFDREWDGATTDLVMDVTLKCFACRNQRPPSNRVSPNRINSLRNEELCRECHGERRWHYQSSTRRRGRVSSHLLAKSRRIDTVFSKHALLDSQVPPEALIHAATNGSQGDRMLVAFNHHCPVDFLEGVLAFDDDEHVRAAVASQAHRVRREIVELLCDDRSATVRAAMAVHAGYAIPYELIAGLTRDSSPTVRAAAATNNWLPDHIARQMLDENLGEESKSVREVLASSYAIDVNSELRKLTRNFDDLFPLMFDKLLARDDLTEETLDEIAAHTHLQVLHDRINRYRWNEIR